MPEMKTGKKLFIQKDNLRFHMNLTAKERILWALYKIQTQKTYRRQTRKYSITPILSPNQFHDHSSGFVFQSETSPPELKHCDTVWDDRRIYFNLISAIFLCRWKRNFWKRKLRRKLREETAPSRIQKRVRS